MQVKQRLSHRPSAVSVWSFLLSALIVVAVLSGTKSLVEKHAMGRRVDLAGYDLLVKMISRYRAEGQAAVVLSVRPPRESVPGRDGEPPPPFSRDTLLQILSALDKVNARAVGIDIDFSPTSKGWRDNDNDELFLSKCLSYQKMPVRVGVYRGIREPAEAWLGSPRFATLAAGMWIRSDDGMGHMRLPVWTRTPDVPEALPTLGAAVAAAVKKNQRKPDENWLLAKLIISESNDAYYDRFGDHVFDYGEILVNYGSTSQISREARLMSADDFPSYILRNKALFENKLVFIGDAHEGADDNGHDAYKVNALDSKQRGVILHATLAQTLIEDRLYELSHAGRLALDIGISLAVVAMNLYGEMNWRSRGSPKALALRRRVYFGSIAGVTVLGFVLLLALDVLWLDFLAVAALLAIHPVTERLLHKFICRRLHNAEGSAR